MNTAPIASTVKGLHPARLHIGDTASGRPLERQPVEGGLRGFLLFAIHDQLAPYTAMTTFVVPHDPRWKLAFQDEAKAIEHAFEKTQIQLHHIGSTAIPGILAKPIIDLLGTVSRLSNADANTHALEDLGYEAMGAYGIEGRRYFRKMNDSGTRTHHLHVFEDGSKHAERHLAFRDYLISHPTVAKEYSALKEHLTSGAAPTWDAYIDGKDPFVARIEPQAVDWYRKQSGCAE